VTTLPLPHPPAVEKHLSSKHETLVQSPEPHTHKMHKLLTLFAEKILKCFQGLGCSSVIMHQALDSNPSIKTSKNLPCVLHEW
jgi:hypothetical protein